MALCLPRKRRAASLATRPSTLSVASITNHSCVTSAGFALNVFMITSRVGLRVLFHGRRPSAGDLLGGDKSPSRDATGATEPAIIRKINDLGRSRYHRRMFSYRHAFHAGNHADVLKHLM